jgi:hypothetical protein
MKEEDVTLKDFLKMLEVIFEIIDREETESK